MDVTATSWEARAAAKRANTLAKIPLAWQLDPSQLEKPGDIAIVSRDSVELVNDVKNGKLTATEVTAAFCKTSAIAHQINNCLHEIFFDQALKRAAELDAYYTETGKTAGPLHGLPISLKDQFHVKGVATTMGYVGWIGSNLGIKDPRDTHRVESQITTELLSLGAVLFCKTSLPQTLLFGETKNNIIGETRNPHNQNLSCGGSSGGEDALQALRGSTLGVGTDIGGSVRIPAGFNGIFSLKPTPERLSYRDVANTNLGKIHTARQLDSSDPAVVPIPFREEQLSGVQGRADERGKAKESLLPLKLGVLWTDKTVGPHPPILRGLHQVVNAFRAAGHKVMDWEPPSHATAKQIHVSFLFADGAHDIHSHLNLSGEPLIPDLEEFFQLRPPMGLLETQNLTLRGLEYEAAYSDYWNSSAGEDGQIVDAVIMPVAPHAAVIPGRYFHTAYTEVINLLDYSSVVIPVTKADKTVDVFDNSYEPLNELDRKNWEAYEPEIYDGAPVGVQLVARKFQEEKILGIVEIVVAALNSYGDK
ncbi:Acetamidase [Podospora aff. communis PSN243]|uniref:Acetamidase n=1 Tax=Podospora aff. communis PSN243 TaxID=3040156 RepID=A0AAV9GYW4_9PEZI|nr:Acetamidase [Podospora aff. communis PSN243]